MNWTIINITLGVLAIIVPFAISNRNKRTNTIKEFKDIFLGERYKITTSRDVQNFGLQENTIRKMDGIFSTNDIAAIRNLWEDYKKAENQYCQAVSPGNGSAYIHYGDHKPKILSKIDKIINYL